MDVQTLYLLVLEQDFANRGSQKVQKIASMGWRRHQAVHANPNQSNEFFALDSSANILHSGITSQTISVAGPAKLMFACQPCCGIANLLTLLFSNQSEPAPSV